MREREREIKMVSSGNVSWLMKGLIECFHEVSRNELINNRLSSVTKYLTLVPERKIAKWKCHEVQGSTKLSRIWNKVNGLKAGNSRYFTPSEAIQTFSPLTQLRDIPTSRALLPFQDLPLKSSELQPACIFKKGFRDREGEDECKQNSSTETKETLLSVLREKNTRWKHFLWQVACCLMKSSLSDLLNWLGQWANKIRF